MDNYLFSDITNILGIDKTIQKALGKLCGRRIIDLLFYRPYNYIDRRPSLLTAKPGEHTTFIATVCEHKLPSIRGKPYRVILKIEIQTLTLIFFHYSIRYLKQVLPVGHTCLISGKLEVFLGQLQITHPDYISLNIANFNKISRIEPIYYLSRGITNRKILAIIASALQVLPEFDEWIDSSLMKEKGWKSFQVSLTALHRPNSLEETRLCRLRLAYDELLAQQIALRTARYKREKGREFVIKNQYKDQILKKLTFELTSDQINAIQDISNQQKSKYRMIRLLQGDVGSGKTIVALFAMLNVVENNSQAALMAPIAILAEQHYNWFKEVLSETDIKVALLTGKTKQKERKTIIADLKNGNLDIVIGTHALFQEKVLFKDLALAVIDEQQRFGVMQRNSLIQKGSHTDILFISATPIPRTLQQALYGDMEYCSLREKPKCRIPINSVAINIKKMSDVVLHLQQAIDSGGKAYWICPCIEESEALNVAAAEERFTQLQKVFIGNKIGLIHGRLNQDQKDKIMLSFRSSEISLLVATTVIEVGIDVPDATIIVIENAEKFGLSQLHQLRGRVGRSDKPSFCVLLYDQLSKSSYLKLKTMRESQDGFYIAQQDMLLRGSGDVLGTKQSGSIEFKFADIYKDGELLNMAYNKAKKIIESDPALNQDKLKELLSIFGHETKFEF